ncbi:MAG TPA: YigZ family protein [Bacillales bacterium]|nr:YigZ family protein [Bacillales bacterium]
MLSSYYTVKRPARHTIVIQKSRFIAAVTRAENEQDAQSFINEIKKENHGANHNCSAYMIGEQDHIQKANDDGEPSGTAGVPMLEVLKKRSLKDTVVVVTRYFGGIKLGAGGLIRAYGSAVTEGLNAAGIVRCDLMEMMKVTIDYTWLGKIENELRTAAYEIKNIDYLGKVEMTVYVPEAQKRTFTEWITNLTGGQGQIEENGTTYLERDIGTNNG